MVSCPSIGTVHLSFWRKRTEAFAFWQMICLGNWEVLCTLSSILMAWSSSDSETIRNNDKWFVFDNKSGAVLCAAEASCAVMRKREQLEAEHPSSTASCQALSDSAASFLLMEPWSRGFFSRLVSPDHRSLWCKLSSERSMQYWQPGSFISAGSTTKGATWGKPKIQILCLRNQCSFCV